MRGPPKNEGAAKMAISAGGNRNQVKTTTSVSTRGTRVKRVEPYSCRLSPKTIARFAACDGWTVSDFVAAVLRSGLAELQGDGSIRVFPGGRL